MSTDPTSISLVGASRRSVERRLFGDTLKIDIGHQTDAVTRRLISAYSRAWDSMAKVSAEMASVAAEAQHSGRPLSPREIAGIDRVDRAMFALERQVRELGTFTGVTVKGGAASGIGRAVSNVLDELPGLAGVDRRFTRPSGAAMQGLVLRSTERIEAASRRLTAEQSEALKQGLFRGLVLGENPTQTAKHIVEQTKGAFFGGLARANNIARTEIADAHRFATRLAYVESEFVVGWKWLASLGPRTCPACWAMHNTFHEKTEQMFAHQSCRCTMVPVLADDMPYDHDLGNPEALFWEQSREDQLAIMGPGRLKALEGGARFSDLAFLKPNSAWRPSMAVTSVADLTGIAELNIATTPGDVIDVPGLTNSSILSYAFAQGGLTINSVTGEQPTSGYVVARNGTSLVVDAREFFGPAGPNAVSAWLTQHGDALDQPGADMGMWYDTANGKVVLDVVQILDDKNAAIALGRSEDQIAIFDLNTFSEIQTGGTGGYTSALTADEPRPAVGSTVTVVVDGQEFVGTVTGTPDYSKVTIIKGADGSTIRAWPDQIKTVQPTANAGTQQAEVARITALGEIAEDTEHVTGIDRVNFSGMTVKDAQTASDTIEHLMDQWPGVEPTALTTGEVPSAFAVTTTGFPLGKAESDIMLSSAYAADPAFWQSDMLNAETRGHFHTGTADEPVNYTIEHEFGHVLDFNLFGDPSTPAGDLARRQIGCDVHNALFADMIADGIVEKATPENLDEIWGGMGPVITKDLSGYGTTQPAELFAEAYAVYRDHGAGESVIADTVMRHYARAYHEKFNEWPDERDLDKILGPDEYQPPEQGALFSEKIGRVVGYAEAKPGLRVTVNGKFGEIVSHDGATVHIKYDDGSEADVLGVQVRHALQ